MTIDNNYKFFSKYPEGVVIEDEKESPRKSVLDSPIYLNFPIIRKNSWSDVEKETVLFSPQKEKDLSHVSPILRSLCAEKNGRHLISPQTLQKNALRSFLKALDDANAHDENVEQKSNLVSKVP